MITNGRNDMMAGGRIIMTTYNDDENIKDGTRMNGDKVG